MLMYDSTNTEAKSGPSSETLIKEGYKKTKLGWIPEEWEFLKLAKVIELESGQHLSPTEYNGAGNGVPYFTGPTDFCNNIKEVNKWTQQGKKFAESGDVLITVKGSGVGTLYISSLSKIAIGRQLMAIRPRKAIQGYIFNFLLQRKRWLEALASGNMIPGLSRKDILNLKIPLPPLPEQKEIADILSTWDRAIETLEQLIAKKEELKKGLMQQLLTGEKRFQGFEGEWNKVKAGKLFNFLRSISVSRKDLDENSSEETVLNLHYGDLHVKYNSMTMLDVGNSNDIPSIVNGYNYPSNIDYAKDGDVIIVDASEDYEGVGECVELKNVGEKKLTAGLHTFLLRDKMDLTVEGFRSLIFEQPAVKKQLKRLVTGSNVFGLSKSNLAKVEVDLPSKEEQRKIVETLQGIESEIGSLKIMRDTFEVQKKGLIQQLLTGKKRVNEIKTE